MKKIIFVLFIGFFALLVACGDDDQNTEAMEDEMNESDDSHSEDDMEHGEHDQDDSLTPVEVEVLVEDQVSLGEITLQAKVTHGGNPVKEADEVLFEVWQKGDKDNSQEVEGIYTDEGIYEASFTFEEAGTYEMYAHVTAKSQHVMPKHEFEVSE